MGPLLYIFISGVVIRDGMFERGGMVDQDQHSFTLVFPRTDEDNIVLSHWILAVSYLYKVSYLPIHAGSRQDLKLTPVFYTVKIAQSCVGRILSCY